MSTRMRIDLREPTHDPRHVLGIHVSADCRRVRAAPLAAIGTGLHMNLRVGRPVSLELPDAVVELKTRLDGQGGPAGSDPFTILTRLRSALTEHVAIAAQEAAVKNGRVLGEMLAIGVTEPGKTIATDDGRRSHLDLVDSALLADMSGVNVVSGFPARDMTSGGRGEPLDPLPLWILFRSAHCDRIFVHVGRVVRLVRLPRLTGSLSSVSGLAFRSCHGTSLVDLLVSELTKGRRRFDAGGRLAVQGRRVDELVRHWLDLSETLEPQDPHAAPAMLRSAVSLAVQERWSVHDMLCSATHFVAESTARGIERLAGTSGHTEMILSGGALANGLILRDLSARLSNYPLHRIEQLGGRADVVAGAVAATLALLHFDQVPANVAGLTGAETPRVLGHLTSGGPQAWQRLLASCASAGHSIRPLRAAL